MQWRGNRLGLLIVVVATLAGTAACGAGTLPGSGAPGSPATDAPTAGAGHTSVPAAPSANPAACSGGWRTRPLTVTASVSAPPVPVATGIRTGSHPDCQFDRLVIDISGTRPGYSVAFVATVNRDASGRPVNLPGSAFLLIRLTPAQGHSASGTGALPQHIQTVGYPMLRAYAVTGDFEGVLSVAVGLSGHTRYRVGELPGRLYLDVAW